MTDVLILQTADKQAHLQAKRRGMGTVIAEGPLGEVEFDRALIAAPGTHIPWHLVDYGLHFLERWDAAAPLWRYGILAQDVGGESDRRRTAELVHDLRVLLYAHELLFVRDSSDGRALLAAWEEERAGRGDVRLAFLRALYRVKPIFCALPRSWLGENVRGSTRQAITRTERRSQRRAQRDNPSRGRQKPVAEPLVRVEIRPGVYVRCHPGHEQEVYERFNRPSRADRRQ